MGARPGRLAPFLVNTGGGTTIFGALLFWALDDIVRNFFCVLVEWYVDMKFGLERCGMKFAHIADLHIGKRVHDFSMLEDQRYILDQMLRIFDGAESGWDVLIAGDVYDKTVPSAEAVQLFDEFITRLAKDGDSGIYDQWKS